MYWLLRFLGRWGLVIVVLGADLFLALLVRLAFDWPQLLAPLAFGSPILLAAVVIGAPLAWIWRNLEITRQTLALYDLESGSWRATDVRVESKADVSMPAAAIDRLRPLLRDAPTGKPREHIIKFGERFNWAAMSNRRNWTLFGIGVLLFLMTVRAIFQGGELYFGAVARRSGSEFSGIPWWWPFTGFVVTALILVSRASGQWFHRYIVVTNQRFLLAKLPPAWLSPFIPLQVGGVNLSDIKTVELNKLPGVFAHNQLVVDSNVQVGDVKLNDMRRITSIKRLYELLLLLT